jgi:predicted transcriptional regulator
MPLPDDYKKARKKNAPKGSLMRDLYETNRDIRRHLKGIEGEVSLEDMLKTKQRLKKETREEVRKEEEAARKDANPRQLSPIHAKPKPGLA